MVALARLSACYIPAWWPSHSVVGCRLVQIKHVWRLWSDCVKFQLHRTIILHIVLYGRETWSRTVREERGLRVFENRALKRIFGPKR
jgi:hypothetical protein